MASQDRRRLGPQGGLDPTIPHHHTAYKIIGVAMAVHNKLGPGHREEVYQQAMLQKLPEASLTTEEQVPSAVTLDGGARMTGVLYKTNPISCLVIRLLAVYSLMP